MLQMLLALAAFAVTSYSQDDIYEKITIKLDGEYIGTKKEPEPKKKVKLQQSATPPKFITEFTWSGKSLTLDNGDCVTMASLKKLAKGKPAFKASKCKNNKAQLLACIYRGTECRVGREKDARKKYESNFLDFPTAVDDQSRCICDASG